MYFLHVYGESDVKNIIISTENWYSMLIFYVISIKNTFKLTFLSFASSFVSIVTVAKNKKKSVIYKFDLLN